MSLFLCWESFQCQFWRCSSRLDIMSKENKHISRHMNAELQHAYMLPCVQRQTLSLQIFVSSSVFLLGE